MAKLVSAERISLKHHSEIREDDIQKFIFENPTVLGLGDLSPVRREKIQPSGGRLDILLEDEDTRYEVEIMLGATDPSHIIRTIEYWDSERKRYPQYDHCAVIVAEEITGRFMNVIGLFNGAIPLVALQMSATKLGDSINLSFTKVIDRIIPGTDDDGGDDEKADRNYWEKKTNLLPIIDALYEDIKSYSSEYEMLYKKSRITINESNAFFNRFILFPKKSFVLCIFKTDQSNELDELLDGSGLDYYYKNKGKSYRVRIIKKSEYTDNHDVFKTLIEKTMNKNEE